MDPRTDCSQVISNVEPFGISSSSLTLHPVGFRSIWASPPIQYSNGGYVTCRILIAIRDSGRPNNVHCHICPRGHVCDGYSSIFSRLSSRVECLACRDHEIMSASSVASSLIGSGCPMELHAQYSKKILRSRITTLWQFKSASSRPRRGLAGLHESVRTTTLRNISPVY